MRMTSAVATVHYQHVPAEVFRDLPFPGADLAANMFQFVAEDNGYGDRRDVALARSLNPSLLSFSEWVAATADMPPLAMTGLRCACLRPAAFLLLLLVDLGLGLWLNDFGVRLYSAASASLRWPSKLKL